MIKTLNEVLLGWRDKYLYETLQNRGEENGMDKLHPNEGIQSLEVLLLLFGGGVSSPPAMGSCFQFSTLFNSHL